MDRERVGAIVFGDEEKRQQLNAILHPYIIARQDEVLSGWELQDPNGIGVVDAALMIESDGYKRFDKLIVVHCRPEVQLERLLLRNKLTLVQAQERIASQMPQEQKQRFADFLIDTSDGFEATRKRTIEVFEKLKLLTK